MLRSECAQPTQGDRGMFTMSMILADKLFKVANAIFLIGLTISFPFSLPETGLSDPLHSGGQNSPSRQHASQPWKRHNANNPPRQIAQIQPAFLPSRLTFRPQTPSLSAPCCRRKPVTPSVPSNTLPTIGGRGRSGLMRLPGRRIFRASS